MKRDGDSFSIRKFSKENRFLEGAPQRRREILGGGKKKEGVVTGML